MLEDKIRIDATENIGQHYLYYEPLLMLPEKCCGWGMSKETT